MFPSYVLPYDLHLSNNQIIAYQTWDYDDIKGQLTQRSFPSGRPWIHLYAKYTLWYFPNILSPNYQ